MTGKGHFLSFIASLARDITTCAKRGGAGTKASIRAILTQGSKQQNITSVEVCPELREKVLDLSHLSLSMEVGYLHPSSVEIGTWGAENAKRKFMEWGLLLPPGEAARHYSGYLRTQSLQAQVQISPSLRSGSTSHSSTWVFLFPDTYHAPALLRAQRRDGILYTEFDLSDVILLLTSSKTKLRKWQAQSPCNARNAETIRKCSSLPRTHASWSQSMQVER